METRSTIEVVAVLCLCRKAVLTATVTHVVSREFTGRVEGEVVPCPECGCDDVAAARLSLAQEKAQKTG